MTQTDLGIVTLTKLLRRRYAPLIALVLVAGSWMVLQRLTMELSFPLGYDEAVYVSQTSYRPHVHWSAPRAYGLPLLMWPLVHFTASTVALRLYASILTALGVIAAYWPWTKVRAWSAVVASALFVTLWISSFYASLAMPNLFTALPAVASVGCLVCWLDQGSRVGLVACFVAVAVMTLVRPTDAIYIALPLFIALLIVKSWLGRRRIYAAGALAAGLAAGWGFWVVEAFVNFGGPLQRMREASAQDGGLHWNLPFFTHVISSLSMHDAHPPSLLVNAWWWLIWPSAVLGVWLASATARRAYLLCVLCAASLFAQYLFLIQVETPGPRTLLPVYALLSLPVGAALMAAVARWRHSTAGLIATGGLVLLVGDQAVAQHRVLETLVQQQRVTRAVPQALAGQLSSVGVAPPCILVGQGISVIAYQTGCREQTMGFRVTADEIAQARSNGTHLAVLLWTDDQIAKHKATYDRVLGVTPRMIPLKNGHVGYLYDLTP